MATAVNPKVRYIPSGSLAKVQLKAAASKTWKQGEFGYMSSGQVTPAVTGAIPYCIFAETQAASTSANDLVWVYLLEEGCEIEIFCTNNGNDAAANNTNFPIGGLFDLYVASNIHYIDQNASTDDTFLVLKHASDYEAGKNAVTDSPGKLLARLMKVA